MISVEERVVAVCGADSFLECSGFALEGLAALCPEEDVVMLVDAWIIKVESSEALDVTHKVVEKVEFEFV